MQKKPAITITFVNGTVQGDSSVTSFPANCNLTVQVPDNADIIFDGVTFNGGVRSGFGWNKLKILAVVYLRIDTIASQ